MSVQAYINAALKADATLAALVGARVYPAHPPQRATYPCVSHMIVSGLQVAAMTANPGLTSARLSITAWGKNYSDALDTAAAALAALVRQPGSGSGVTVQDIFHENGPVELIDERTQVHYTTHDLMVWYS